MSTRWENELIKEIVELRDKIYELNIENTRQRNYIIRVNIQSKTYD